MNEVEAVPAQPRVLMAPATAVVTLSAQEIAEDDDGRHIVFQVEKVYQSASRNISTTTTALYSSLVFLLCFFSL